MANNPAKLFFGGLPTEPEVNRIRSAYPDAELTVGQVIPYDNIAAIIGAAYKSNRFRSITNVWRKKVEKETNKIIGTEPGVGFVVLSESQKVNLSGSKLRSAARFARRSYMVASRTDVKQLSEEEARRLTHQINVTAKIIASAQLKTKKQLPDMTNGKVQE